MGIFINGVYLIGGNVQKILVLGKKSLFLWLLVGLMASCANLKRADRPRYDLVDNLTSRYNILFHAKEIIAQAEAENREAYRPNYQDYLAVFIEPNEVSIQSHAALMDSVLGKTRRVIHEKGKGKYVDDANFLTARAYYVAGNYYNAAEYFSYVVHAFPEETKLRQQARIWHGRSLLQLGAVSEAMAVMDSVFVYLDDHRGSRGMAFATRAQHHLSRGELAEAAVYLQAAIEQRGSRSDKLRWHYLLGQLLEAQQLYSEAAQHYRKVARSNASYEMSFQAGLRHIYAQSMDAEQSSTVIPRLRRMLRDDKNKDFKDQIYHAMADRYVQEGNWEEAIKHYQVALGQKGHNRHQQTQTYLSLAQLYFDRSNYAQARHYYDSAAITLPPDFRNVDAVRRQILQLDKIMANLQTVKEQQELLSLAELAPELREQTIDQMIREEYAELLAKTAASQEHIASASASSLYTSPLNSPFDQGYGTENMHAFSDGRFYFNNADAIGMGVSAFRRQWGNRPLTDNWRYGSLSIGAPAIGVDQASAGVVVEQDASRDGSIRDPIPEVEAGAIPDSMAFARDFRTAIESSLPLNDSLQAISTSTMVRALEENGEIYRFILRDYPSSIGSYQVLLELYPEHEQAPKWLYHLYQLHEAQGEARVAGTFRDRILSAHGDSEYAHILLDPDYFAKKEAAKRRADLFYEEVYTLYTEGQFEEVIRSIDEQAARTGTDAQLQYLRALAIGRTSPYPAFEAALDQIAGTYPGDSLITPLVEQHLAYMAAFRETFLERDTALLSDPGMSERFLEEPRMTAWPPLRIETGPIVARETPHMQIDRTSVGHSRLTDRSAVVLTDRLDGSPELARTPEQTSFRDQSILPDTATYYFVVHVMHPTVNLAPSRFGIGQFNRTRYADAAISHQLKTVNDESQLLYIGPFHSYQEVKVYEARILPLIGDMMRIPADVYQTFVVTETIFGTLSDFGKIDDYYHFYNQQ